MIAPPEPGAPPAVAAPARALAERLPAEGAILVLGDGAWLPVADRRPGVERRAIDDAWDHGPTPAAAGEAGAWRAIVLEADSLPDARSWPATLDRVRRALEAEGRLFVVSRGIDGRAPVPPGSDAVAALYEAGFSVTREDAASASGSEPAAGTLAVIEARPDSYLVRLYRDGDESAILRLFEQSFAPRSLDHWTWKYRDNPFGTLAISEAIGPAGELVAHYAAYPVPFRRSRAGTHETVLCHQVGDTMTDPRHRHVGRGRTSLLGRTARHFYARRCEAKVAFNYGFNTGNIQRFSQLFVGARKVCDIEVWSARPEDLRLAKERRFRPYRATLLEGGALEALDPAFDRLFERAATHYGFLVERRRPYLTWRYLRCPDHAYRLHRVDRGGKLVGFTVTRVDGDRVLLGDALFDPEHVEGFDAALRAIVETDGATSPHIEGWFARHPAWWSARLAATGFTAAPQSQGLGMVFVPFLECPDEELRSGYYLTMGDSDLF